MPDTRHPAPVILDTEDGDELEPVPTALEEETGHRPHPTTTSRYCLRGVAGVVLPSLMANGCRKTTRAAVRQWLRDVTAARNAK